MSWWNRLWRNAIGSSRREPNRSVRLTLPGWNETRPDGDLRIWRDVDGDVLSLAVPTVRIEVPRASSEIELRRRCRNLAQDRNGGLIEAQKVTSSLGPTAILIYKRLQMPAYIYTGMLLVSLEQFSLVWTIVAGEHGTTGLREAIVTATLMEEGKLTLEEYKRSWAQDPYDPAYSGVDRSVLRFVSDDKGYDEQFPTHPLTKVRHVLAILPGNIQLDCGR